MKCWKTEVCSGGFGAAGDGFVMDNAFTYVVFVDS